MAEGDGHKNGAAPGAPARNPGVTMAVERTGGPGGIHSPELDLGGIRVRWLYDNDFHLDGGAMFGVVPKVLWSRRYPCDERNFIPLVTCPILVEAGGMRILIDTGLGDKLNEKQRRNFGVRGPSHLEESLAALGLAPEDIDVVVLTHFDFDHASGVSYRDEHGQLRPRFPRARHVIQAAEWDDARHPDLRTANTYWRENWEPLAEAGLVEPLDGEASLAPGVRVVPTGGHTRGHQVVLLEGSRATALHLADLLPTHGHRNPLLVMAYDNFPLTSVEQKRRWLEAAVAGGWWILFYHDPFVLAARPDEEGWAELVRTGRRGLPGDTESPATGHLPRDAE
ncbi:MAG TPA: MBL fold metallo-hydrolase [Thermaerobacter sp.]